MEAKRTAGFTLLEVTVALLVTSLIIITVASSLAMVTRAWERAAARTETRRVERILVQRLGAELAALETGPFGSEQCFEGSRDGFKFYAYGPRGRRYLALSLAQGRLVLTETSLRGAQAAPVAIVLAEEVMTLVPAYYDAAQASWRDAWPAGETDYPPSLVRLQIDLGPSARARSLPPLILPVHAGRVLAPGGAG